MKIERSIKKANFAAIIGILLLVSASGIIALASDYKYVGSSKSNKYHYPTCQWAQKIKPEYLVKFQSAKEALNAGYIPCKVCNPPTKE